MNQVNKILTTEQKEAVSILSISTFLEYFDLMLYVHMGVLLNDLFFPKVDAHTAALFTAAAFCSTYLLRPLGVLFFGWITDNIGRKNTVILTTLIVSMSCIMMANLPTYAEIGITATWIITICRMVQGMSSTREIIVTELYLTEITKPPIQYPAVTLVAICCMLGSTIALAVASLVTAYGLNWRLAFCIGTVVSLLGAIARISLKETTEFVDIEHKMNQVIQSKSSGSKDILNHPVYNTTTSKKTFIAVLLIHCAYPVCFYFTYIYCGNILKTTFNYTAEQVIYQNFIVSMIALFSCIAVAYLSYYIHPIKILKVKLSIFLITILVTPYLFNNITDPLHFSLVQLLFGSLILYHAPATSLLYKHIAIFRRFTYSGMTYALSHTIMYLVTSFGLVYLTEQFDHYGLLVIVIPITLGFAFGVYHIEELEKGNVKPVDNYKL